MGGALVAGLLRCGWASPEAITIVEVDAARRDDLSARHPGLRVEAEVAGPGEITGPGGDSLRPDGAVIAVKPVDVEAACTSLRAVRPRRVLSIAAGVNLTSLESWLGEPVPVVRAMPNMPALVGSGAAAIAGGRLADGDDLAWARGVLEAVGTVVTVAESALDAVTGLSGSGPAYVFLLVEALIEAGVLAGLARTVARELAVQTVLGSARLLQETGDDPAILRAAVTSPAGTTAAGLRVLEAAGVRSAVLEAVAAATERARQLGRPS
jgi:pyrroline-5-carboxylate reductase